MYCFCKDPSCGWKTQNQEEEERRRKEEKQKEDEVIAREGLLGSKMF
jgi:hypothetical protein